jgi:hypothetical protein
MARSRSPQGEQAKDAIPGGAAWSIATFAFATVGPASEKRPRVVGQATRTT